MLASILLHQHQMEEQLEARHLQTIVIPARELQWARYGKELILNKQLFDVKSFKRAGDSLVIQGLPDEKETVLRGLVSGFWNHQNKNGKTDFFKKIPQLFQCDLPPAFSKLFPNIRRIPFPYFDVSSIVSFPGDIFIPPPDYYFS